MSFWNKKIINFEDEYFGLDLSDLSVKVFQLKKIGSLDKIVSFNCEKIPPGAIEDGKIINKEKVSFAIKEAIKKSGPKKINTNKVICSLPESKVFLRIINMPAVGEDEVKEAIKWEIEANIPLSVDQVYYDWEFLNKTEKKQNILTVAVAKEIADEIVEVLELSGLSVYGLEMESIASARSLIPKNCLKNETFLIVDIGGEKASFLVVENNFPCLTSSTPFSSSVITDMISNAMNVGKEEAEKIKISEGFDSYKNNNIFQSIKPFLENLSVEIEKTMDFYQNMSKSPSKISRIIVSGGGANLKGLISYFAVRLSRDVTFGDPWINLNFGKNLPIISKEDSVRYATAIGLAMKNLSYGNKT